MLERDIQKLKFAQLLLSEVLENLNEAYNNKNRKNDIPPSTSTASASASIALNRCVVEIGWISKAMEHIKDKKQC